MENPNNYEIVVVTASGKKPRIVSWSNHKYMYPTYYSWLYFLATLRECNYKVERLNKRS